VIGITWRGGGIKTRNRLRSIPLPELAPLFNLPRLTWVSLQRGGTPELAATAHGCKTLVYEDMLGDLDETAAMVQALDCVVTADNTVAHLAGALGRPTMILLPDPGDWRWMRDRATSPWYPSVKLYRQEGRGDWTAPITAVVAALSPAP